MLLTDWTVICINMKLTLLVSNSVKWGHLFGPDQNATPELVNFVDFHIEIIKLAIYILR